MKKNILFECNIKAKYTNQITNWKFARTDYSEWSEVKVQAKSPDSKRASTMATYRFPKGELTYSSPYLSWENLLYCGGYSVDGHPYLQNIVQQEKNCMRVLDISHTNMEFRKSRLKLS